MSGVAKKAIVNVWDFPIVSRPLTNTSTVELKHLDVADGCLTYRKFLAEDAEGGTYVLAVAFVHPTNDVAKENLSKMGFVPPRKETT